MRVLLASSGSGSRGGGEIFLHYLGKGLSDCGHEILMWIPRHARMDDLAEKCAGFARIIRPEYRNTYDYAGRSLSTCLNWSTSRRIADEWKALRPDVVHINKQNLEDGLDLLRAAGQCGLPSVCTIHLTQSARYLGARAAWLRDLIARWHLIRYKGVFVAVQERRCEILRTFLSGRVPTSTIFNGAPPLGGVDLSKLRRSKRRQLGLKDSEILILGIGRLEEQKRPLLFLQFAKQLRARIAGTKFLWVGDGRLFPQWQEMIARERLRDVVSTAGWQADVLPYLAAGDLLLHVAKFEGLPFVVIEAMAAGLACAVTRDLALEVPLFNADNVLCVDDMDDVVQKMQDPTALARIAAAGRNLFEDKFSLKTMAQSYEQLYLSVTEGRREGTTRSDAHERCVHTN